MTVEAETASSPVDRAVANGLASMSQRMSRRSLLARLGMLVVAATGGTAVAPSIVNRLPAASATHNASHCYNWRNCGMYGRLCSSVGGGSDNTTCPSGSWGGGSWYRCCCSGTAVWTCGEFRYADCCKSGGCSGGLWCRRHPSPQPYWDCGSSTYCCTRTIHYSTNC